MSLSPHRLTTRSASRPAHGRGRVGESFSGIHSGAKGGEDNEARVNMRPASDGGDTLSAWRNAKTQAMTASATVLCKPIGSGQKVTHAGPVCSEAVAAQRAVNQWTNPAALITPSITQPIPEGKEIVIRLPLANIGLREDRPTAERLQTCMVNVNLASVATIRPHVFPSSEWRESAEKRAIGSALGTHNAVGSGKPVGFADAHGIPFPHTPFPPASPRKRHNLPRYRCGSHVEKPRWKCAGVGPNSN
jgi:hypothetical protein